MIIAIDGPAGSGKSTTARLVAQKLGFIHINTGAMYRGIALKCIEKNVEPKDHVLMQEILNETLFEFGGDHYSELYMDGRNISSDIKSSKITESVSRISAVDIVREKLVKYQQEMAEGYDVVLEGRDIGTVVFPNADYKFFLVADVEERALRRMKEMKENNDKVNINDLIIDINERDRKDSTRENSPLKKAEDAIQIDTTDLSIENQVNCILKTIENNNNK